MNNTKEQVAKYRHAYLCQKNNAKKRGIEWRLTFDQWLEWWGDDIYRRSNRRGGLQMQRFGDTGPYSLGNIKKGTAKENSATAAKVAMNKKAERAKREHEALLDSLMWAPSKEEKDGHIPDDEYAPMEKNGLIHGASFLLDKRL